MTILTYHRIINPEQVSDKKNLCVSPSDFFQQLQYLIFNKFKIVSLDEYKKILMDEKSVKKVVAITFDDGTKDLYENALPIIEKIKVPATFFVSTNPLQNIPLRIKHLPEPEHYLSAGQVKELHLRGISIASHGKSHIFLAKSTIEQAKDEIFNSKTILENIIGIKINWFCYPYGNFNKDVIDLVKQAGYAGACSVIRDNRNTKDFIYCLKRVMIMKDTSPIKFKYYFSSLYHLIHKRKNKKRWELKFL